MDSAAVLAAASDGLLPARQQMAFTLGYHIILACLGVALPAIVLVANWRGLRRDDPIALTLARRWSTVMAVTFAVGAVTGTVLSFEMGLLWPGLMDRWGAAFGFPFAVEGIFFFLEAIFIAIYIYGWRRLAPWPHFWSGVPIVLAGIGGALAVVSANSWMNQPAGFELDAAGRVIAVDPLAVIFNRATLYEVPHMILAAYMVAGFLAASVYAVGMLRGRRDRYHVLGFTIPFTVAAVATPLQILVGDVAARSIADHQPAKYAAMEYVTKTGPYQPEYLGGILVDGQVRGAIEIPWLNSIYLGFSPETVVTGLDRIPPDRQPPAPTLIHLSFNVMVVIGFGLLALALWFAIAWWRRRELPRSPWFLRSAAAAGVAAIVALEAGWIVTEVGRQPWIVYERMRTVEAVTSAGGLWYSFAVVLVVYLLLAVALIGVLRGLSRRWRLHDDDEARVPYGPRAGGSPRAVQGTQ